jgi:hypothetical protein
MFRLQTYVGSNDVNSNEAINTMPALVGSTLVGIDNTNKRSRNFVEMTQHFFSKNNEGIYLNNVGGNSGSDWWYDVIPNVYFYQLYDLYPAYRGEASLQFTSIADQFLSATKAMGGSQTPWKIPNMNYRAWNFTTMQGNTTSVPEPESAGTFAWLMYHAYKETNDKKYLLGAEWSMDFLNSMSSNPSYELQLPYGIYAAAKMNAELGTKYDIEKMVNWSFNRGALRGWGTIVGKWGGFDVSGLVGEANDQGNDYAFQLNGVQQAAALVPLVRYDKRFATTIAKWVLNLANATRLYYPGFLPSNLQDSHSWSSMNDKDNVIGYEALKQKFQNQSPFSTGDALGGGWAKTNLSLYSTSSIGYLACLIEKTNEEKILQLNLNATDLFNEPSYPSYLYYNPTSSDKTIMINVGSQAVDIYESLEEKFISQNVKDTVNITISAKQTLMIVLTPASGILTYNKNKMLINDVVVDYMQTKNPYTFSPRIKSLSANRNTIEISDTTKIFSNAIDHDSPNIEYQWSSENGLIIGNGNEVIFKASDTKGNTKIKLVVKDNEGNVDSSTIIIDIVTKINKAPMINRLLADKNYMATNEVTEIICEAIDDGTLSYEWTSNGTVLNTKESKLNFESTSEGIFEIEVKVKDEEGLMVKSSIKILVYNFKVTTGKTIAKYPFSGNANDVSGNNHNGIVKGGLLTADRNGLSQSAYYFNGGNQHLSVNNDSKLNFNKACSFDFWFKLNGLPSKETFILSHGSWQNRLKISLTPSRNLRWTLNTVDGIKDLDSDNVFDQDVFYNCTVTYDGALMCIYVNGELNAYARHSGLIRITNLDLLIGQMLSNDAGYNFKGVIDDISIFDKALTPIEVENLFKGISSTKEIGTTNFTIIPNPTFGIFKINSDVNISDYYMQIIDINGKLIEEFKIQSNHSTIDISKYPKGIYTLIMKNDKTIVNNKIIKL